MRVSESTHSLNQKKMQTLKMGLFQASLLSVDVAPATKVTRTFTHPELRTRFADPVFVYLFTLNCKSQTMEID
jgi:hypothetical protein